MQKHISLNNGRLDFAQIETLEAQCRRHRSEAIFDSLSTLIKWVPRRLAGLAASRTGADSRTGSSIAGASAARS